MTLIDPDCLVCAACRKPIGTGPTRQVDGVGLCHDLCPITGRPRAVIVGRWPNGSPEWHAARANSLGGSEIAAVLGLSPYDSRFSLWHRKAGAIGHVETTPEMEWGTRLEPAICAKYFDTHPEHSDEEGPAGTWAHPDRPWQHANPDRLIYRLNDNGTLTTIALLETKFSLFGDGYGEAGTDQVPIHVRTQALWYLDVLGLDTATVAVLVGGYDYREYTVTYDPTEARQLVTAGEQFLDDIANGVRPDIDEHSATYDAVKEMHPDITGAEVELTDDTATGFIEAKHAEKAAKDHARQATARVADEMGDARRATWDGRTIATRQARGDGTPYVVVARGLTDIDVSADTWTDPEGEQDF